MLRIICNNFIPSIPSILLWWKEKISQIIDIKIEKYTQYKLFSVVKKMKIVKPQTLTKANSHK